MNIEITKNKVLIDNNYILNDKEYNVSLCKFSFSEEYTNDLVKKAVFIQGNQKIEMLITNNQCNIPNEVLNKGQLEIHVYAYQVVEEELILRYSPSYATTYVRKGSYVENATNTEPITPTDKQQMEQEINNLNNTKQDNLVSGTNIKTINGEDILGEGNLEIEGGGGTSNYENLKNKPKINNIELNGNKTLNDLGIIIPDVSNFITKEVDNLDNYTKSSDLSNVATSGNYNDLENTPENISTFNNDVGYLTEHQDLSGKLDTNKVKNANSTTAGDVYDVRYINTMLGDIESLLGGI